MTEEKGSIIKKGFLNKQGHVVKNWKTRLFVLERGCEYLYYYKDEKDEQLRRPVGAIPLVEAKLNANVKGDPKAQHLFEVSTVLQKSWVVSAKTAEEKDSWVQAIQKAIVEAPASLDSMYLNAEERNKEINKLLKETKRELEREIKLLLLGPGDAGKSTIVKQMKLIHLNGYSQQELLECKPLILHNILFCLKALIFGCKKLELEIGDEQLETVHFISELQVLTDECLNQKLKDIKLLWKDAAIQQAFKRSHEFQLPASCPYWIDNLDRIGNSSLYVPTVADILRCRVVTTGISETIFSVENVPFRLVDVGGQRSERKKWIHCFDNVTAVIFCIAINEYDLMLVEDETVNRMHESVQLFDDISNDKFLKHIPMIVFLNKSDLFKEKIAKVDMKVCFPEYNGGCDYQKAISFIEDKLVHLNRNPERQIYTHVTCATDTENIKFVFAAVKSIVLQSILDDNEF